MWWLCCRPPSPPAPPGTAVLPDSGDCLITFADLPGYLTISDETGGIITNSLGLFPRECGLSFHSEHPAEGPCFSVALEHLMARCL